MFEGNELIPRTGWLTGGLTDPSLWRAATLSRPLPRPRRIQAESHEANFNDLSTVNVKWSRCMFSKFCSWREHAVNVYYLIINYCLMLTLILYESRGYYDDERAYRTLWKRVIVLKLSIFYILQFKSIKSVNFALHFNKKNSFMNLFMNFNTKKILFNNNVIFRTKLSVWWASGGAAVEVFRLMIRFEK